MVIGTSPQDMAAAVNHIAAHGGGQVVVDGGRVVEFLPLPIGGGVSALHPPPPATADGETTETADVVANDAAQADDSDDASEDRRTARLNQLGRDLRARVAAGEITEEQARQRMSRMRQRMEAAGGETAGHRESADQPSEADITDRINQAIQNLRDRLEAGEITEEQYRERLAGIRRRQEAARGEGRGS